MGQLNACDATRLLEQLLEKEREYQSILQQVLEEREQEIRLLRLRSEPAGRCLRPTALPRTLLLCLVKQRFWRFRFIAEAFVVLSMSFREGMENDLNTELKS